MRLNEIGIRGERLINRLLCFGEFALRLKYLTLGYEVGCGFWFCGECFVDLLLCKVKLSQHQLGASPYAVKDGSFATANNPRINFLQQRFGLVLKEQRLGKR